MKNRFLWMLAAILTLSGTMLTLTSCSDDDTPDQTYDTALKPGDVFEEMVKSEYRHSEHEDWRYAEYAAQFKVLEGDFLEIPQVSLNQIVIAISLNDYPQSYHQIFVKSLSCIEKSHTFAKNMGVWNRN